MPRVDLLRGSDEEVKAWVMRGTADVGVTEIAPSHPQFRHLGVFADRLVLAGAPAVAEAYGSPTWESLVDHGPILLEQSDLTPLIVEAFERHGVDARRLAFKRLQISTTAAALSAIEAGRCAGLVSERAARHAIASGALARIGRLEIPLRYWMFSLREREIEGFASLVAKAAQEAAG